MAQAYENARLIKEDVLDRAGESISSSTMAPKVIRYMNRVQRTLCAGASEFLPEFVEDWWWMRSDGVLTLAPVLQKSVAVVQDSPNITFTTNVSPSVAGYKLRVINYPEVFDIITHTVGTAAAVLDSPYTGPSATLACQLMKVTYPLDVAVNSLMSPMVGFQLNAIIPGIAPERMDDQYPLSMLQPGVPRAFSLENRQLVRFSHGGRLDGQSMRVEYRFRKTVDDLIDDPTSIPLVPLEWRHLLADMALTYVLLDKNDDRSNAVALSARTGLAAMLKENRRELTKIGGKATGHIYPRQADVASLELLRTQTGLIIAGP